MSDFWKNFLKGLLYIAVPVGLNLVSQALVNRREEEVFNLRVQQAVDERMKFLLEAKNS